MKNKTALPKGVWFQKKTLASGEVVRYGYLGRGPGMAALGKEGGPDFYLALAEALRRAPEEGKVSHLIWRYKSSEDFKKLRDLTRRDYLRQLDKVSAKFGRLTIAAMASPSISDHIFKWRDEMAKASPRQADYAVSVLSAMLKWSVNRGLISANRAAGVGDVYTPDRKEKVWTPEMEEALIKVAPAPIQRAAILALETGLSQEDLLVLPWSAVRGNLIVTKRLKNGTPAVIPISPKLKKMLDEAPRTATTILTTARGVPYNPNGNGLRSLFRLEQVEAKVLDRTFHDMRGTFITRRRALGWTAEETALCSGHKVAGEAGAQGSYVDREAVAIQNATRLWARFYRPKRERKLQTSQQTASPEGKAKPSISR